MAVQDSLKEIARIDREIASYLRSHTVILLNSPQIRKLKEERRGYVSHIQNYKPRETN